MVATSFSQLITLSFYYLVINPTNTGVFRLKLPGDVQSGPRENLSTNTINKNFFCFSGQHWTELSIEKCKKSQFLGCLIKI